MTPFRVAGEFNSNFFGGGLRAAVIRVLITGISVFLAVMIVPGLEVHSFSAGLAAVLVLTFLNLLVRPILLMLTLPLIVLSLGLFLIVVNALLLEFTAYLVTGFSVTGFWPAVGGSVVISLVTMILNLWTSDHRQAEPPSLPRRPPKIINPDE
ncbi:MAG TPA: phage holin family protein [Nitrospiraceae bacterium]|nr:phage holin family protein [Nitrospiraceae bacterium]